MMFSDIVAIGQKMLKFVQEVVVLIERVKRTMLVVVVVVRLQ